MEVLLSRYLLMGLSCLHASNDIVIVQLTNLLTE